MPHEAEGQLHWHEPAGLEPAGVSRFRQPPLAYDRFIENEDVPAIRAASVVAGEIALADWRRLAARGAYLPLFGNEGALGLALIEVPAAGSIQPEQHLFEEILFVLEGRGTAELWLPGSTDRVVFEWQPGSLFSIPPNALHRLVNATNTPALLLSANTAPALLNLLGDVDAVFANPFLFQSRFDNETGQAFDAIEPDPVRDIALCRTSLVPDAIGCDLPLDNRLSPGHRRLQLAMTGLSLECALGEHRPGRYGRAQLLDGAAASVCLRGRGYLYLWPERLGPAPWRNGLDSEVLRIELHHGVITGSGPGGGRWYQQTFVTSAEPLRQLVFSMPPRPAVPPGMETRDAAYVESVDGGCMIGYAQEDAHLRTEYAATIQSLGLPNRMKPADYAE